MVVPRDPKLRMGLDIFLMDEAKVEEMISRGKGWEGVVLSSQE